MVFIHNKYTRIYYSICSRARKENRTKSNGIYEAHHFLPKSIFPQFKSFKRYKWNKVLLTPKEHFICHLLLTKMFEGKNKHRMQNPIKMMALKNCTSSRSYDLAKKLSAGNKRSDEIKDKIRQKLLGRHFSDETKDKLRQYMTPEHKAKLKAAIKAKKAAGTMKTWKITEEHKDAIRRAAARRREAKLNNPSVLS